MRRRSNIYRLAISTLTALITLPCYAQTTSVADRSLSWCEAPSANPEWALQPIFLVLKQHNPPPKGSNAAQLSDAHLAELLGKVRTQFRSATVPSASVNDIDTLASADARYTVPALRGSIAFRLRGDGTIDSLVLRNLRDSTLFNQLAAALVAGAKPGALTPFGAHSDTRSLTLEVAMSPSKSGASWGMFMMTVPRERFVTVLKRPSLAYPVGVGSWKAEFELQFYVDTAGKPEPRTIVEVTPADSMRWPNFETRVAYQQFVRTARRGIERATFTPAEFLGCRYRRLVNQPMQFYLVPRS